MTMTLHIYRLRWFQWTWFQVNRPSGCWVTASTIFLEPLSGKWACPLCPHGQMTMTLHICRLRRFQWTWFFGVNRPSGCWVPASARFQEALSRPRALPQWNYGASTVNILKKAEKKTVITKLPLFHPKVAYFSKEINSRLAKPPLNFHGSLAKLGLTSLVI